MLSADLTLAPFDLGVAEDFNMYSAPSDIEGIDVITVSIFRLDGSKGAWLRGNRRFVGKEKYDAYRDYYLSSSLFDCGSGNCICGYFLHEV